MRPGRRAGGGEFVYATYHKARTFANQPTPFGAYGRRAAHVGGRANTGARVGKPVLSGSVGGTWQRTAVWGQEGGIGIAMNRVWGPYDERRPPSAAAICAPMPRIGPSRHRFPRQARRRAAPSGASKRFRHHESPPNGQTVPEHPSPAPPAWNGRISLCIMCVNRTSYIHLDVQGRLRGGCGTAPLIRHPWASMRGPATAPLVPTSVDTDARSAARHIAPGDGHADRAPHGASVNGGSGPRCAPPRPARRASPPTHPSRCRASRSPRSGAPWDSGRRARGRTPRGRSRRPAPRRSC